MAGMAVIRSVWILSAAGLVGSVGYFAIQPYKLPDPGKMVELAASDHSFSLLRPSGWKAKSRSLTGFVRFEPASQVVFELETDLAGSLLADLGTGNSNLDKMLGDVMKQNPQFPGQLGSPVRSTGQPGGALESLHESQKSLLEATHKDYRESAPTKCQLGGLQALESTLEFTGSRLWGARKIIGRRVSAMSGTRPVQLLYYGPADQMAALERVFHDMRASIKFAAPVDAYGGR